MSSTVIDTAVTRSCPSCDGPITDTTGELVCRDCDLVIEDTPIDHGQEWRGSDHARAARTGAPRTRTLHDNGLGTTLGGANYSDVRREGNPTYRRRWRRMHTQHVRARIPTKRDTNRVSGLIRIRMLASTLALPESTYERACAIFAAAHDAGVAPGRSLEALEAGAVLIACREHGRATIADDIVELTPADDRYDVLRSMRVVADAVGAIPQIGRPMQYLERVLSDVDAPMRTRRVARTLCHRLEDETDIAVGRRPTCVAAGIVWVASCQTDGGVSQASIADAVSCSGETVREIAGEIDTAEVSVDE